MRHARFYFCHLEAGRVNKALEFLPFILFLAHRDFGMPAMVSVKLTPRSLTAAFLLKSPLKQESFPRPKPKLPPVFLSIRKPEPEVYSAGLDRGVVRPVHLSHQDELYGVMDNAA